MGKYATDSNRLHKKTIYPKTASYPMPATHANANVA